MPRRFLCVIVCLAAALAARAATAADIKVMISAGFFNVYAIHRKRSRRGWRAARKPTF